MHEELAQAPWCRATIAGDTVILNPWVLVVGFVSPSPRPERATDTLPGWAAPEPAEGADVVGSDGGR